MMFVGYEDRQITSANTAQFIFPYVQKPTY